MADLNALIEPFANCNGDLPDYDHPLRCVYESGIQYAVELLARMLSVVDYEPCDGTEEFDGDLGGTMLNIVLAAMPHDVHGDPTHPSEVSAALSAAESEIETLREALRRYGDRIGMANAPAHLQQGIDAALSKEAAHG